MLPAGQRTILLVEDNAADANLVIDELREAPASPRMHTAAGGRAAIAMLRDPLSRPDLVLLDLNLPGFSGLETLAELKADDDLRRVPVIMLTTSKSQNEIDRCYELGAAAVLNKPLRLREYRALLEAFATFWLEHVRFPESTP